MSATLAIVPFPQPTPRRKYPWGTGLARTHTPRCAANDNALLHLVDKTPGACDDQAGFTGRHCRGLLRVDLIHRIKSLGYAQPTPKHIKDSATGLTYMQARYYDPLIGRFLSIDPVGFNGRNNPAFFNRYAYTFNDPVNLIDPDGNQAVSAEPAKQSIKIVKAGVETSAIFTKEYVGLKIESALRKSDASFTGGDQQAHFVANSKASAKSPFTKLLRKPSVIKEKSCSLAITLLKLKLTQVN
jgi:RHS repeat-associated protein